MSARTYLEDLEKAVEKIPGLDSSIIDGFQKSIKKHELYENWSNHPVTKEVFLHFAKELFALNSRLSTDVELAEVDRRAIFLVKSYLKWLLLLPEDSRRALQNIEDQEQGALAEIDSYKSAAFRR